MKELFTLNKYLYKYKWKLVLGTLFIIGLNFFMIYKIRFVGESVNFIRQTLESSDNPDIYKLFFYGIIIIVFPIIAGFLQFLMRQTIIVTSRNIEFDLKNVIYKHYQYLDISFYKRNKIGDLMNRISEDVGYVRMYLGPGIMYPINLIVMFLILTVEMLSINKTMTFFTLLPLPFLSLLVYFLSSKINKKSIEVQDCQSELSAYVQDIISGIRVIKSFNKSQDISDVYTDKARMYKEKSVELANINAFFTPLILVIIGLSQIIILYIGGRQYIDGQILEIGTLAQFFMYMNMLIWPFTSLGWVSMVAQRAEASMKRINEFLNTKPSVQNISENKIEIKGEVIFKNVSFLYKNTGIQALEDISFKIEQGKTLAILGNIGSGKTTIAELISRLYDPTSGEIFIDGLNLKEYNLYNLRAQIGVVPQEAFLFSNTIRENLTFGNDEDDETLAKEYAEKADVHKNIVAFSQGYETKVGERGVTLSGGQKQRVAIARALLKKPKILIFDDSLSAVDTETEERILTNIREESKDKTTIIITHRVSSVKHADNIIILDNGKILQEGTHTELMKESEYYKEMYILQTQVKD